MKIDIDEQTDAISFVTLEPIPFRIDGTMYLVPAGYRSDGMSVPRFLWRFLDPSVTGKSIVPAIIHDYCYDRKLWTRREADDSFYERLVSAGYPRWKSIVIHIGLRLFGWTHWR